MKRVVLFLIIFLLFLNVTHARKGVGIVVNSQSELLDENKEICIDYGIYNPWDEDVKAALETQGDINSILSNYKSEEKLVPAGTTHSNALPVRLCFRVADVYKDDCLLGNLLCEQKCESPQVSYSGEVTVVEKAQQNQALTGSQTNLGVSAPLAIKVKCQKSPRNYTPLWFGLFIVVLIIFIIWIVLKNKKPKTKQSILESPDKKTP